MAKRKNLKISPETYTDLKRKKPKGVSWDALLDNMLRKYEDPRPLFPKFRREDDGSKKLGSDAAVLDHKERAKLAERAKELQEEINFKRILQESEDITEAKATLLEELLTDKELSNEVGSETVATSSNTSLTTPADTIAELTADRVVKKLEGKDDG